MATYTLEEVFQNSASLLINETRNALDTTTTSEAANSRLGNALNVIAQNFAMALGTSLSETLATFSTAGYERLVSDREQTGRETLYRHIAGLLDWEVVRVCVYECGEPELLVKCAVMSWKRNVKARLYGNWFREGRGGA